MKKLVIILSIILSSGAATAQLRPLTSTYPFNGLLLNPAYAGSLNKLSAIAVYRRQWLNIDGAPTYAAFTAHSSFMDNRIGVGLQASQDKVGANELTSIYGSYAYKIKTGVGILAMGLQGGFDNSRFDPSKLSIFDKSDGNLIGISNKFSPNFGTGLYFANPRMYVSVAVPYILENKTYASGGNDAVSSEARQKRYYYITGGVIIPINEHIKFTPTALIRAQQSNRLTVDITPMIIFDEIAYLGISYRTSKDITFIGQLILNENLRVGYAYDATASQINTQTTGSHEILLNYRIKLRNYKKDPQCPVYF